MLLSHFELEQSHSIWERALLSYDAEVRLEIRNMLKSSPTSNPPEDIFLGLEGNKVLSMRPVDGHRLAQHCNIDLKTQYLVELVVESVLKAQYQELKMFYRRVMEVPGMHRAAGIVFENLVHEFFKRRSNSTIPETFTIGNALDAADQIPSTQTFTVESSEVFENLVELGEGLHLPWKQEIKPERQDIYLYPKASTLGTIDSLLFCSSLQQPLFFQITVAKDHSLKVGGLKALYENIPAQWRSEARLIFVVPQVSQLTTIQPYSGGSLASAWPKKLYQRVFVVTDEELFAN